MIMFIVTFAGILLLTEMDAHLIDLEYAGKAGVNWITLRFVECSQPVDLIPTGRDYLISSGRF